MEPKLVPYLMFNGNAEEAMTFYQSIFGGELEMQTYGEAMKETVPEQKDKIMHAELKNGPLSFMGSDGAPGTEIIFGNSVHLNLTGADEERLGEFFNELSLGGVVNMPLEKQFWGDTFGMLTDKFGIHWMINIFTPPA